MDLKQFEEILRDFKGFWGTFRDFRASRGFQGILRDLNDFKGFYGI